MKVLNGINLLGGTGRESNIYIIDNEVLVDTGTGQLFSEIKKEMTYNSDYTGIKTIVNTHFHHDHSGGNKKFRDWLGASVACHTADAKAIETGKTFANLFNDSERIVTVDKVLRNGSTIKTENFSFEVIHTPGHSQGSICLYEKNKHILISGDTLFESAIGRTDLAGGSDEDMISSLKKLSNLKIEYLLPGHGPPKIGGISFLIKQMIALKERHEAL
jgi:hydroxyacylglutathione hydrolase